MKRDKPSNIITLIDSLSLLPKIIIYWDAVDRSLLSELNQPLKPLKKVIIKV